MKRWQDERLQDLLKKWLIICAGLLIGFSLYAFILGIIVWYGALAIFGVGIIATQPSLLYKLFSFFLNMWREKKLKDKVDKIDEKLLGINDELQNMKDWVNDTIDEKLQEMRKEQQSIRNDMQAMEKRFDEKLLDMREGIQDMKKDINKIKNMLESKGSKYADE